MERHSENSIESSMQLTELVSGFSPEALGLILKSERECMPEDWQYSDADEYYEKMLRDPENINIFLKNGKEFAGYVLARFHNKELAELVEYDPGLKERDGFYIETIQILPKFQGKGGLKKLLLSACEEGVKRGITKFSIHARTVNDLDEKVKKIFAGKITLVRQIEKWKPAQGEAYEYIEWELDK